MARFKQFPDLSLVLAFGDDEDTIGDTVRGAAQHLRALGCRFELIAVNEGSRDNTLAVLELLAGRQPELALTTICRDSSGRAFGRGAVEARGRLLVLARAHGSAPRSWSPLGLAVSRLAGTGAADALVLPQRLVAARRATALPVVARARGATRDFERRFQREAEAAGVRVEVLGRAVVPAPGGLLGAALDLSSRYLRDVRGGLRRLVLERS